MHHCIKHFKFNRLQRHASSRSRLASTARQCTRRAPLRRGPVDHPAPGPSLDRAGNRPRSSHQQALRGTSWLAGWPSFRPVSDNSPTIPFPTRGLSLLPASLNARKKSVCSPSSIHVDSCMNSYAWPLFLNTSVEQWHVANRHPLIVVPPLHDTDRRVWHEQITPT